MAYDPMAIIDDIRAQEASGLGNVLPESYYPMGIRVLDLAPSKNEGTPGLELGLTVSDGPFAGAELDRFSSVLWLTPGKPEAKGEGRYIGLLKHMTHQVTGKQIDPEAFKRYGFDFSGTPGTAAKELWRQFNALDSEQKVEFMRVLARVPEWDGKTAVFAIGIENETRQAADGTVMVDENGNPVVRSRNRISNIYSMQHERYGIATVRKVHFPLQLKAQEAMGG